MNPKNSLTRIKLLSAWIVFLTPWLASADTYNWNGGSADWDTTTANWSGFATTWPAASTGNDDAVFGGTAGTVNLTTGIGVNDMTFNTTGYNISGANTLTLNGTTNVITTGAGVSASISSILGGTAGFTKSGTGTLTLNGSSSNSIATAITVREGTLALDFTNMTTPTNLLPSTATITMSPTTTNSKLLIKGHGTVNTSQTLASLTAGTGTSMLLVDPNNTGSVTTTLTLSTVSMGGTRGFNSPRTLIVGVPTLADESRVSIIVSANNAIDNGGVVPGNLLYTNDGGATVHWATHSPTTGPITRTVTPSNVITDNFTASATVGSTSAQILVKTTTSGQSLDLNGNEILTGYGILFTGAHDYEVKNGRFNQTIAGSGTQNTRWMANHHYGTGVLTISARLLGGNQATATGGFTKTGPGTTVLTGANTYSNTTFVDGGVLSISSIADGGLQTPPAWTTTNGSNTATVSSAAGLQVGMSVNASNIIPYGTKITNISGTTITLDFNATATNSNQPSSVGFASGIGISKNIAANLVLAGGTLRYTGAAASTDRLFDIQANSGLDASGTGALNWTNTGNYTVSTTAGPRTLTLSGTNTDNNTLSGLLSDQAALIGQTSLIKQGAGKWILTNANTFAGGTSVTGGTLLANNASGSALGTGDVTVSGGTLGGTGSITGMVTISGTGTLSPGASIESLNTGSVTFNNGSTYAYELTTATLDGDLLNAAAGSLTLSGTVALTLSDLGASTAVAPGSKLSLISYNGTWNSGIFSGYADDSTFTLGANSWTINYNDTTGGANVLGGGTGSAFVTITAAIPEPAISVLAGVGVVLLAVRRRRQG